MPKNYKQGKYIPKHPEKYVGDVDNIVYRSSWELEIDKFLDNNPNVLRWNSEEIFIPYYNPVKQRVSRYFPDFWVEYKTKTGEIVQEVLECKPIQQTKQPRANHKHRLYEQLTFAVNTAKWQAAQQWCNERGIKFRIVSERSIFK